MTLKKRLINGGIWVGTSTVLVAICTYLYRIMLANNLTVEQYGLIYAVTPIFLLLTSLFDFGRTASFFKYGSDALAEKKPGKMKALVYNYFTFKWKIGFVLILIIVFSSNLLISYLGLPSNEQNFYFIVLFGVYYVLVHLLFNPVLLFFQMYEDQKMYSIHEFLRSFSLLALTYICFQYEDIFAVVIGLFASSVLTSSISYLVAFKRYIGSILSHKIVSLSFMKKKIYYYSISNIFFNLGRYLLSYTDTFMLTAFIGLSSVGLYNAALPTARLLLFFLTVFTVILIPLISKNYVKRNYQLISQLTNTILFLYLYILLPVAVILISYSDGIINLIFGSDFALASIALKILALSTIFNGLFTICTYILNGLERPMYNTKITGFGALLNVSLNLFLIPLIGMNGAALATLISYTLMAICSLYSVSNAGLPIIINYRVLAKIFYCNLLLYGMYLLIRSIDLFGSSIIMNLMGIFCGLVIYLIISYSMGLFSYKNIKKTVSDIL